MPIPSNYIVLVLISYIEMQLFKHTFIIPLILPSKGLIFLDLLEPLSLYSV